ncbi:39S ribosomal protein L34, mitochondrial [Heptranchias perlo]|uniref:39S ribosomal protein L34, mitochondrial n=1 Tax=Heptranchias perlo TaxID=212740 RepID=UPI0035599585
MSFLTAVVRRCRWHPAQYLAPVASSNSSLREICSSVLWRPSGLLSPGRVETAGLAARLFPWNQQQVRTKKRGTEYQPKTIKRIRTHGWQKRISTRGGIEVILRRMLKGRTSLTH